MKPRLSSLLAVLLLSAIATISRAADPVVYSQPYTSAEDTTWDSYTAPGVSPATVYDDFTVAAASDITAVQWQGTYIDHETLGNNPAAANATSFVVSFYADNGGQPGTQIFTATIPVEACAQTSLGTVGFNAFNDPTTYQIAFYSYRATLPGPFTAAAGQTYWFSVVGNNGTATPVWSWYASTADGSTACYQDFQGNRINRPHDRAFALEGTAAAAAAPAVSVAVTKGTVATSGDTPGIFTLSVPTAQSGDLHVAYSVKGTGINGTDYVLLKGSAKIKAGKTTKAIKVVPQGNLGGASKKTVVLTLQPGAGYTVGTPGKVKVKIIHATVVVLP